jgi:hypothetical protein
VSTIIEATIVDPAERDEVPRCWTSEARGFAGRFSFSSATRPWNWMELDAEDADKLFALLSGFVAYFNARYGQCPEQRIPPCWAEHGALVEELTTLFWARWHAFESPHASIGGAQYWHSYTLPSFYERMRGWLGNGLVACQHGHHRDVEDRPVGTARAWELRTEVIASLDFVRRTTSPRSAKDADSPTGVVVAFLGKEEERR